MPGAARLSPETMVKPPTAPEIAPRGRPQTPAAHVVIPELKQPNYIKISRRRDDSEEGPNEYSIA